MWRRQRSRATCARSPALRGLSLGDRACLALAQALGLPAMSARDSRLGGPGGRDRDPHGPLRAGGHIACSTRALWHLLEQAHSDAVPIAEAASCAGRVVVLAAVLAMAPLGAKAADLVVWWEQGFYPEEDEAVREIIAAFEQETGKQVELAFHPQ